MINWRLIGVALLFTIGIYMCFAYQETDDLSAEQKQEYQRNRYIGFALIALSIGLCLYFYYTGAISFKASMPGDCADCNIYVKRHRGLYPYKIEELRALEAHAKACRRCSDNCVAEFLRTERQELAPLCERSEKYASLSENELGRLRTRATEKRERLRKGYAEYRKQQPEAPLIFPEVPE